MKKNIVIIILTILVLGLGGYLIYDKVITREETPVKDEQQNTESDKVIEQNDKNIETNENKFSLKKGTFTQRVEGAEDFVVIVDNGQAYLTYDGDDMTNNIRAITSKFTSYKINNYIIDLSNPDAGVNCYKLEQLNNVVAVYDLYQGNNGVTYFTFILDNGKVALIKEEELLHDGKINVQILEGLENIVTFVQARTVGAYNSYAIDINGNQIDLANYLK